MISIKGLKRLKALALTILEKNGLEFFSDFFLKSLNIFSLKNKSFYEVKPVPNESPVTLLATHAKKNWEFNTNNYRKSTSYQYM